MKILVVFNYSEVQIDSEEAAQILANIGESCEALASRFDASECWVQECFDDGDEDAANNPEIPESKILGQIFGSRS